MTDKRHGQAILYISIEEYCRKKHSPPQRHLLALGYRCAYLEILRGLKC
jgi:hypothetical protein